VESAGQSSVVAQPGTSSQPPSWAQNPAFSADVAQPQSAPHSSNPVRQVPKEHTAAVSVGIVVVVLVGRHLWTPASDTAARASKAKAMWRTNIIERGLCEFMLGRTVKV